MKLYGLTEQQAESIASALDLELENLRRVNKNAIATRVIPHSARSKYARTSGSGRRLKATCYHGIRDYIREAFKAGAYRVQSTGGDWRDLGDFNMDLVRLYEINVGSIAAPVHMWELCQCDD